MKPPVLLVLSLVFLLSARANTYYSTNNASPNSTSSWHTSRNGTGGTPSNFSGSDIFVVQANHSMTTTANWNLSGNNSRIIIEGGATLQANHKITVDIFQAYDNGTYIHNDNSSAFPGNNTITLGAASTVEVNDWNGSSKLPAGVDWGNLIIDMSGYGSNMNQAGDLNSIAGDFIIRNTGNSKEFRLATTQDYTLTIGGDLIIEGGILEASSGNANADQTIIINGSFIQTGGTFTRSNNNSNVLIVQFNGTNSGFTQSAGTLTGTNINWKVNAAKKLTLSNNLTVAASRSMTVAGTLDFGTRAITGAGTFTLSSGGLLVTSNTSGLVGSLTNSGTTTLSSGGSYEFRAATTTPFPASLSSVSANNLTIGANVTTNKDITASGTITLNSGKLIIPAGNTITVSSGNAVAGSGFGTMKQIATLVNTSTGTKGYFRIQNYTGTTTIPVGNSTYYLPVTLTAPGTNDFSICVFNGVTNNGQPNGTAFTANQKKTVVDAVWQVNRNSGAGGVTMQLGWPSALEGSLFQNIVDNQIGIAHYGSYWEACFGTGSQSLNTATRTVITSFSPFGVGYTGIALPLKFGDIRATRQNTTVQIDWSSYSENGLDHYEVERSTDGKNFSAIATVAAGNNGEVKNYSWTDNILNDGIFFYRVKGVDIDGRYVNSSVVRVSMSRQGGQVLSLYPNPSVDRRITFEVAALQKDHYTVSVYDRLGNRIFQQNIDHNGGSITQQLQLPAAAAPGVYSLLLTNNREIKLVGSIVVR